MSPRSIPQFLSFVSGLLLSIIIFVLIGQQDQLVESSVYRQHQAQPMVGWFFPSFNTVQRLGLRAFRTFQTVYHRNYSSQEMGLRMKIFLDHFRKIYRWNNDFIAGKVGYSKKVNFLADRTEWELARLNGVKIPQSALNDANQRFRKSQQLVIGRTRSLRLPHSVDLRHSGCVSPVRSQHSCGCCYAFATVDLVSTSRCLEEKQSYLRDFYGRHRSPQEIVDCATKDSIHGRYINGCDGGSPENVLLYLNKKGYLAMEWQYPYKGEVGACKSVGGYEVSGSANNNMTITNLSGQDEFQEHLARHGPIVGYIHASDNFVSYDKGIFDKDPLCGEKPINHAILVVGYGREAGKDYWLIKNSWGTDWGSEGYMKVLRGQEYLCGLAKSGTAISLNKAKIKIPTS